MSAPAGPRQPRAAVFGGGPAGLMAAQALVRAGVATTLYEQKPSLARKFLMAGRGGLNLTHSEPLERFLARYREAAAWLRPMIEAFPPRALADFSEDLGQPTFVGSSGRVFPVAMKASPLLRAWLRRLAAAGLAVETGARLHGFDATRRPLVARGAGAPEPVDADAVALALGGASWPRLGADGLWTEILAGAGVAITPRRASNMGVEIAWSELFAARFSGAPLKSIRLSVDGETAAGEAIITARGLEGGALYALSAPLRAAFDRRGEARLVVDLKPGLSAETLAGRLASARGKDSLGNVLRKAAHLSPVATALLRESEGGPPTREPQALARRIKAATLRVRRLAPIDRAISSAGGIARASFSDDLMLNALPGVFVAGEMLDFDAPTGGYLLQAAFATGKLAGESAAAFARARAAGPA